MSTCWFFHRWGPWVTTRWLAGRIGGTAVIRSRTCQKCGAIQKDRV